MGVGCWAWEDEVAEVYHFGCRIEVVDVVEEWYSGL